MLMKWIKALRVYFNPRMLTMVGLGFFQRLSAFIGFQHA